MSTVDQYILFVPVLLHGAKEAQRQEPRALVLVFSFGLCPSSARSVVIVNQKKIGNLSRLGDCYFFFA